jgi:chromosomal replication initiation ATPase DnaA
MARSFTTRSAQLGCRGNHRDVDPFFKGRFLDYGLSVDCFIFYSRLFYSIETSLRADLRLIMRVGRQQIRRNKTSRVGDKQLSSVDHDGQSVVDAIQWATAKVFRVSLHDLVFGTTTLHINDYPEQLRLARAAAFYLCRKHAGLAAATIARAFNRRSPAVAYAVRSIERLLTEEPRLGELLSEVEREFGRSIGTNDGA